jgi:hypothetical protein
MLGEAEHTLNRTHNSQSILHQPKLMTGVYLFSFALADCALATDPL